jgi:shikimate kinase
VKCEKLDRTISAVDSVSEQLQGLNLYLIGMMGAGKTTVGKVLAQKLGYRFFDTDVVIEQVAGQTIAHLFATAGEPEFRVLETQVLAELAAYRQLVVATGGGIVVKRDNWGLLRHGIIVWLDVPVAEIVARLEGDTTRPLLQTPNPESTPEDQVRSLLTARQSLYAQADLHIVCEAGDTPEHIALQILAQVPSVLKSPLVPPGEASP